MYKLAVKLNERSNVIFGPVSYDSFISLKGGNSQKLVVHPAWYFIIIDDRILFIVRIFFVAIGVEVGRRRQIAEFCRLQTLR